MAKQIFSISLFLIILGCSNGNRGNGSTWTLMVFMDGDNNLSSAALADLSEMEDIGSTDNVKIVVEIDTLGDTAKRYLVEKDRLTLLSDIGEVNMADPDTLSDFITWTATAFPADRMALILWDHGDGWAKGRFRNGDRKIFIDDDNHGKFVSNHLIKEAIAGTGRHFDIIGLDASKMGEIETAYEFRNLADIFIFSQEIGQENGWDYDAILQGLTNNPGMDGVDLSKLIVSSYKQFYEEIFYPQNPKFERFLTISAIRLGPDIDALFQEVDLLAGKLIEGLQGEATRDQTLVKISSARDSVQELDPFTTPFVYIDLLDLDQILNMGTGIADIYNNLIVAEYHGTARPNAHGVSIVFFKRPESDDFGTFDGNYRDFDPVTGDGSEIDFINKGGWDEFLGQYYNLAGLSKT